MEMSAALEKAVQLVMDKAQRENKTVDEVIDELKNFDKKKIREEQLQARDKRKKARAENELKTIERKKRNHFIYVVGGTVMKSLLMLGKKISLSEDDVKIYFPDFLVKARTADGKNFFEYLDSVIDKEEKV